jgi:hypothetical protein
MNDHDFRTDSDEGKSGRGVGSDAFDQISRAARDASSKAKETASETATALGDHFKEVLDKQMGRHIGAAGILGGSLKQAASDLEGQSPIAASIVRTVAGKLEQFAEDFDGETVEQLARSASDFTRRQPAIVFGVAALAGFFALRAITITSANTSSPSIQPSGPAPQHE